MEKDAKPMSYFYDRVATIELLYSVTNHIIADLKADRIGWRMALQILQDIEDAINKNTILSNSPSHSVLGLS